MIKYDGLQEVMKQKNVTNNDIRTFLSPSTLIKLREGQNINTDNINKLCKYLGCQPSDIMRYEEVEGEEVFSKKDRAKMLMNEGYKTVMQMPDTEMEQGFMHVMKEAAKQGKADIQKKKK